MGDSKSADGAVDDLLLGDGFSIVDSTKGDTTSTDHGESKSKSSKSGSPSKSESSKVETSKTDVKEKKEEKKHSSPKRGESAAKEDTKLNGHEVPLLITTEEDLELPEKDKKSEDAAKETAESKPKKKESEKKESDTAEAKKVTKASDKRKQGDVWVSNITRHVKATDLKKHFARHGKVLTAKIVTNGKSFFGYILMENSDVANKCVKSLHGTTLEGCKIAVSRQRPDQRKSVVDRKTTVKVRSDRKAEKKTEKTDEKKSEPKKDDPTIMLKRNIDNLRREVDYLRRELTRTKRFLTDEQRRARIEQGKNRALTRDLQEAESKLREEKRKVEREREMFEKNQRTDRVKMESDRSLIKKELEEVKKLREYLKRKLEEEQSRPVERRPRASSPYAYSSKRFRESSGGEKPSSKYVEERTRTPPSPPKLSSRSKRSPINSFVEKDRRGPSHHYSVSDREEVGSRHSSSMVMSKPTTPAAPRNIWPSFHQEVWRVPPGSAATSTPFGSSQSYSRQSEYTTSSSSKPSYSSQQREFSKRDHYSSSSSVRKY